MNKVIAVIPARSGSRGVRHKNLRKLGDKSLTKIAVEFAHKCKIFDHVVLSSDSEEILSEGVGTNTVLDKRPHKYSMDNSFIADTTIDIIDRLGSGLEVNERDWIVLLEPTSPFRTLKQAKVLHKIILEGNFDSIVFVTAKAPVLWRKSKNCWSKVIKEKQSSNRQDRYNIFLEVNCFFATKVKSLRETKSFSSGVCKCITIQDELCGVDINSVFDLKIAEYFWEKYNEIF